MLNWKWNWNYTQNNKCKQVGLAILIKCICRIYLGCKFVVFQFYNVRCAVTLSLHTSFKRDPMRI